MYRIIIRFAHTMTQHPQWPMPNLRCQCLPGSWLAGPFYRYWRRSRDGDDGTTEVKMAAMIFFKKDLLYFCTHIGTKTYKSKKDHENRSGGTPVIENKLLRSFHGKS